MLGGVRLAVLLGLLNPLGAFRRTQRALGDVGDAGADAAPALDTSGFDGGSLAIDDVCDLSVTGEDVFHVVRRRTQDRRRRERGDWFRQLSENPSDPSENLLHRFHALVMEGSPIRRKLNDEVELCAAVGARRASR